jgi:hypothetical protein
MTTIILTTLLAVSGNRVTFPGPAREVLSPCGQHSVVWNEPDGDQDLHRLVLANKREGTSRLLRTFGRWVRLSWAPDGHRVAITVGVGSDSSEAWVYDVEPGVEAVDVGAVALARVRPATVGAHHLYVEVVRWVSTDQLLVRVHGYGGARALDRTMRIGVRR